MPYNTRRKSISLHSLGIHIPVTNAARAAAAAKGAGRQSSASTTSTTTSSVSPHTSASRSVSPDSHPSKRIKRSHRESPDLAVVETTPPSSPTPVSSVETTDSDVASTKVSLEGINDDIVEATITQLQDTANRPHLVKDLATVLALSLTSVQNSANPCAIISSRLASYMKRPCWNASTQCPLAKELETVHPRRTYYFLTTCPRQPLPESGSLSAQITLHTSTIESSVSLTDDSSSDEADARRRELSPSPEIDLASPDFDDMREDGMPSTPIGSLPKNYYIRKIGEAPHDLPPLEKDEREFTQTADIMMKRKFVGEPSVPDVEYGCRDDFWFGEINVASFLASPAVKPNLFHTARKEDEAESWMKLNKLFKWDQNAESIEIDELDGLLDGC